MTSSLSTAPRWLRGTKPASAWRTHTAPQVGGSPAAQPPGVLFLSPVPVRLLSALSQDPLRHLETLLWQQSALKALQKDRCLTS